MHGCNKRSTSRSSELETKSVCLPTASKLQRRRKRRRGNKISRLDHPWEGNQERSSGIVFIRQVLIILSRHICEDGGNSCCNVCNIRTYSEKLFPCPICALTHNYALIMCIAFFGKGKNELKEGTKKKKSFLFFNLFHKYICWWKHSLRLNKTVPSIPHGAFRSKANKIFAPHYCRNSDRRICCVYLRHSRENKTREYSPWWWNDFNPLSKFSLGSVHFKTLIFKCLVAQTEQYFMS